MQSIDNNTLVGFIGGIVATIIGFSFTLIWEIVKSHLGKRSLKNLISACLQEELEMNSLACSNNLTLLQQDNSYLLSHQTILSPLNYLRLSSWDLVISNLEDIKITKNNLDHLATLELFAEKINETIRLREDFKISNAALSTLSARTKGYNDLLISNINEYLVTSSIVPTEIKDFKHEWKES